MGRVRLAGLALLLVAGCLSGPEAVDTSAPTPTSNGVAAPWEPLSRDSKPRTLQEAPSWLAGEWWRYRVETDWSGESPQEITLVAVGQMVHHFVLGYADRPGADPDRLLTRHLPQVGAVNRTDLSHVVHNTSYRTLQFPLREGNTWNSDFEGFAFTARVVSASNGVARIEFTSQDALGTVVTGAPFAAGHAVYNASVGQLSELSLMGYGVRLRLIEHGYDFEGSVRVPYNQKFLFHKQRIASVGPALRVGLYDTHKVGTEFDHLSLNFLMTSVPNKPTTVGYYRVTATSPDGKTTFQRTLTAIDGGGIWVPTFGYDGPAGTWIFELVCGGPGAVSAEGIGYESWEISMPAGSARRIV